MDLFSVGHSNYTIGFTQKNAQKFFETLKKTGVKRVVDTRLNNVSQLAGFAKKQDLEYFLRTIGDIDYIHILVTVSLSMPWAPPEDWESEAPCWKLIAGAIEI